jgi:transposase
MGKYIEVFVAFDVAKKKHAVAIAEGGRTGGDVENSPLPIERTIKRLAGRYDRLHICFEAGPTGYRLYRQIQALGHECMVVAPALIPPSTSGFPSKNFIAFRKRARQRSDQRRLSKTSRPRARGGKLRSGGISSGR